MGFVGLNGVGAYLGLPKAINGGELNPDLKFHSLVYKLGRE